MNTIEQRAAYINAQVACAQIEAMGMIAENMQAQQEGRNMVYHYHDFTALANKYGIHHNAVLTYLGEV